MPQTDPRVDAYIDAVADFAKPLLRYWREQVHAACPAAEETMKWSRPHFVYGGKILTGMSAFKAHCAIGFWYEEAVAPALQREGAMGQLGRVTSLADLPPQRELRAMIERAAALIDAGDKPARQPRPAARKPPPEIPPDMAAALQGNRAAAAAFAAFPPGAQREYTEWITEAKREETRAKRLAQAIEWIAEGKRRNWKYENC